MLKSILYLLFFCMGIVSLNATGEKPHLFIFLGKEWCPWSDKIVEDILGKDDFILSLKEIFIVDKIDVSRTSEDGLDKKYKVDQVPTFLLLDKKGEELARVGYLPKTSLEMAEYLKQIFARSDALQTKFSKNSLEHLPMEEIRHGYLEAKAVGFKKMEKELFNFGIEKDSSTFFLLAQYKDLQITDRKKIKKLRNLIEERDPGNKEGALLQMAILDFQTQEEFISNPHKAVKPLKKYLKNFGDRDIHNRWRIEMILAHYFLRKNEKKEALDYAQKALKTAPLQAREDIDQIILHINEGK